MRWTEVGAITVSLCVGGAASAGVVGHGSPLIIDGQISRVDLGVPGSSADDASTVDTIRFSTTGSGLHTIDLLSWEVVFDDDGVGHAFDLNADGLHRFFDTEMYLFRDDGDLGADDLIESNGDSEFPHPHEERGGARHNPGGHRDGSIFEFDSFIRIRLEPGDYLLRVGAFSLSLGDALDGLNDTSPFNVGDYPLAWDASLGEFVASSVGDYRATIRFVPAPNGALLIGAAVMFGARRQR